jgi:hypothetical protein
VNNHYKAGQMSVGSCRDRKFFVPVSAARGLIYKAVTKEAKKIHLSDKKPLADPGTYP